MTAILILTPEERSILLEGRIAEPGYRPFPHGRNDHKDDHKEYEYEELLDFGSLGKSPEEFIDEIVRVAAANQAEPEVEDLSKDQKKSILRELTDVKFERVAAAQYWNRSTIDIALLFARVPSRVKQYNPEAADLELVALARASAGPRAIVLGARKLTIGPCRALSRHISATEVLERLPKSLRAPFSEILTGPARKLPPATSRHAQAVLADLLWDYQSAIRQLIGSPPRRQQLTATQTQTRDALITALKIFSRGWRSLSPQSDPQITAFAAEIDTIVPISEDEAITDDAAVFPGWDRSTRSQRGWWEFQSRDRRLLVKNINVSTPETRTGADLIYVRRDPDALVLVQYKMMEQLESGEWIFRPRTNDRLFRQLEKLLSFVNESVTEQDVVDLSNHRLGPGFTFVKFIEGHGKRGLAENELTPGYYLPAELVRELLKYPDEGPQGGRVHYICRRRSIDTQTFVKLIQDSWIGSVGATTELLEKIVGLIPSERLENRVVAVDEPLSSSSSSS